MVIPPVVASELTHSSTPEVVANWIRNKPVWLDVVAPKLAVEELGLDAGETEAIALVRELKADRLLMDESKGRRTARGLGIAVMGTLGVLEAGHVRGYLNLGECVEKLRTTDFSVSPGLLDEVLRRNGFAP